MWWRIELRNFRSIESCSVELAPFTTLVGPNASGKSNFVDALVLARDLGLDAATALERRGGILGVRRWSPTKPNDVTVDIRAASSVEGLDTDYVRHRFTIKSGIEGDWYFQRELIEVVQGGEPSFRLEREGKKIEVSSDGNHKASQGARHLLEGLSRTASAMVLARQVAHVLRGRALAGIRPIRLNPHAMRQPQLPTETHRLDADGSNIATVIRKMSETKAFDRVLAAMQKIVPGLREIRAEHAGRYATLVFAQQGTASRKPEFAGTEMSEGSLRALGIIVAAQQMKRDELLIIEEPEVNLHPDAALVLFEVLEEASSRGTVLITTHSPELLDAAVEEEILVCDYSDGITRIGPLSEAQRQVVRQGLFSIAELMRSEPLRIEGDEPHVLHPNAQK